MSTSSSQPPGWYAAAGDPPGTQRWWDGEQWVGGPVAAAPSMPTYGAPPPAYGYSPTYGAPPPAYGSAPGYGGQGYAPAPNYASWWSRVGASLLDGLIVGVVAVVLVIIGFVAVPTHETVCTNEYGDDYLCTLPTGAGVALIVLLAVVGLVALVGYYTYFVGKSGQTLGRRAVGIAVVDRNRGTPIGYGRALGRYLITGVIASACAVAGIVDVLWPLWDAEKQTLHDKVVSSIVVRRG